MRFSLFILIASLVFSCSKSDDGDSASVSALTSSVVEKELPAVVAPPAVDDAQDEASTDAPTSGEEEISRLSDQEVISIKSAFFQVEQRTNKEIGLEFMISGNNIRSSMTKRCESADPQALKECLATIRKSLEDFVREGGAVIGDNSPELFRSELVKLSLASDWLQKVNRNSLMVR